MLPTILDFSISFTAVLWEAIPFIVLGALIAGILEEFLPQQAISKILPRSFVPAVMIGAVLGLIFPMCECGIVVVMRRLLRKGLPLSCCIAYMLAGPIINFVVILSTWIAFRDHQIAPEMVGLRIGLGFIIACVTGFVVHYQHRRHGNALLTSLSIPPAQPDPTEDAASPAPPRRSFFSRIGNISATALHDFVDITVFLILGSLLAALARQYITNEEIESFSRDQPFLAIPAMMLLAFVICLCSEADAFVAASFTKMHLSAKLAFLVMGPMLDIKLIFMFTRVFRPRLIMTIIVCVVVQTLVLCMLVHFIYMKCGWSGVPPG